MSSWKHLCVKVPAYNILAVCFWNLLGCVKFAAKLLRICSILQLAPVHCMVWCNISSLHRALPSDNILQQCKPTSANFMIFARFGIMSENCAVMFTALWNKKSAHCLETTKIRRPCPSCGLGRAAPGTTFGVGLPLRSGSAQLAKAMPWPPTVPAESYLRASSLPLAGMTGVNSAQQRLHTACKSHAVATDCAGRILSSGFKLAFGRHDRCKPSAAAPHSLQKRCCGHRLCRQTLFLGAQVCRLAALKGENPPQRLHTACKRAALATTCAGRLFSWGFKCAIWPP